MYTKKWKWKKNWFNLKFVLNKNKKNQEEIEQEERKERKKKRKKKFLGIKEIIFFMCSSLNIYNNNI